MMKRRHGGSWTQRVISTTIGFTFDVLTLPSHTRHVPSSLPRGLGVSLVIFVLLYISLSRCYFLRKLALYGMSDCDLKLFTSFLNNRQHCINVGTRTSSLSPLMYGIHQGSVLGPILFSLYINDSPLYIKALCELFADDTSMHNHHTDLNNLHASLQNCLDN